MHPTSDVFSAIADATRRTVLLRLLREGEINVTDLKKPLSISQPAVSRHLRILREAELIRSRKEGRQVFYEVLPHRLKEVHEWVSHFERYWDEKLDALGEYLDQQKAKRRS